MELYLSGFGKFLYSKFATAPGSKTKEVRDEVLEGRYRDHLYLLESFASYRGGVHDTVPNSGFILDSGAFTFLTTASRPFEWMCQYAERYGAFVGSNGIENFVELDMYDIYGIDRTAHINKILKRAAGGREPIPVWHKGLGVGFYKDLCKSHKFIMIGGIASGDIKPSEYDDIAKLVAYAHRQGVAVHGLGFSRLTLLKKMKFDKVDSTAWVCGKKYAYAQYWVNGKLHEFKKPKKCEYNEDATVAQNVRTWLKIAQDVKRW